MREIRRKSFAKALASPQPLKMSRIQKITYVALGVMGYRIAGRLSTGFPVSVWNRTNSKAESHAAEYGTKAILGPSPFDVDLSDTDLLFTCLPTSNEVETMVDACLASPYPLRPGAIWVDNTSGKPSQSVAIARKLEERGIGFLDVPVSGGGSGAAAGTLTLMVGGKSAHLERAQPALALTGTNIIHIGEEVGSGHAVKALNNLLYGCNILLAMKASQAFVANGVDPIKAMQAISTSSGGSNSMKRVIDYVANNRQSDYSFKASLLVKDMDIGISLVDRTSQNDPVLAAFSQVRDVFQDLITTKDFSTTELLEVYEFIEQHK